MHAVRAFKVSRRPSRAQLRLGGVRAAARATFGPAPGSPSRERRAPSAVRIADLVMAITEELVVSALREHRLAPEEPARLRAAARTSVVVMPVTIALKAIRDKVESEMPIAFTEKRDYPPGQSPLKAEYGWTMSRVRWGWRASRTGSRYRRRST